MVEWLSWLPYISGLINSNILELSKNRRNTLPNLMLLEQRAHELVGGSLNPPQRCGGAKGLDQEGLTLISMGSLITFMKKSIQLSFKMLP